METNSTILNGRKLSKQKIVNILYKDYRKCLDLLDKGVPIDFIWSIRYDIPKKVFNTIIESPYVESLNKYENYVFMFIEERDDILYKKYFINSISSVNKSYFSSLIPDILWKKSKLVSDLNKYELKLVLDLISSPEHLHTLYKNNKLSMEIEESLAYMNLPRRILNSSKDYEEEQESFVNILYKLGDYIKYFHTYINDFTPVKNYLDVYFKIYDGIEDSEGKHKMEKRYLDSVIHYICKVLSKVELREEDLNYLLEHGLLLNDLIFQSLGKEKVCEYLYSDFSKHRKYLRKCILNGYVDSILKIIQDEKASVLCEDIGIISAIENIIRLSTVKDLTDVNIDIARLVVKDLLILDCCIYNSALTQVYINFLKDLDKNDKLITSNFIYNIVSREPRLINYISENQMLMYLRKVFFTLVNEFGGPNTSDVVVLNDVTIHMLGKLSDNELDNFIKKNKKLSVIEYKGYKITDFFKNRDIIDRYLKDDIISENLRNYLLYSSKVTLDYVNSSEDAGCLDINYYKEFMLSRFKISVYTSNTSYINLDDIYED